MEVMVFPTPMMIHQQVLALTVHNNVDGLLCVHYSIVQNSHCALIRTVEVAPKANTRRYYKYAGV